MSKTRKAQILFATLLLFVFVNAQVLAQALLRFDLMNNISTLTPAPFDWDTCTYTVYISGVSGIRTIGQQTNESTGPYLISSFWAKVDDLGVSRQPFQPGSTKEMPGFELVFPTTESARGYYLEAEIDVPGAIAFMTKVDAEGTELRDWDLFLPGRFNERDEINNLDALPLAPPYDNYFKLCNEGQRPQNTNTARVRINFEQGKDSQRGVRGDSLFIIRQVKTNDPFTDPSIIQEQEDMFLPNGSVGHQDWIDITISPGALPYVTVWVLPLELPFQWYPMEIVNPVIPKPSNHEDSPIFDTLTYQWISPDVEHALEVQYPSDFPMP